MYGSSSLYQKTGQQLLVEAMMTASNPTEAQKIVELAGSELKTSADFIASDKLFAYCVIPLPHASSQSGVETPSPFPSELLESPIVITINLRPLPQLLKVGTLDATPGNNDDASAHPRYGDAYLQVRQFMPIDRGQLLKPSDGAYIFPTVFFQQSNSVQLANSSDSQEVVLTGFRSGSCKGVVCWMVDISDTDNVNNFILPRDLVLSYAGNVIHNFKGVSSQALQIYYDDIPAYLENSILADAPPGTAGFVSSSKVNNWIHFPFSQRFEQLSAEYTSVAGLSIANGVMNLTLKTPTASPNYRLFYVPYYESAMLLERGGCEFVF